MENITICPICGQQLNNFQTKLECQNKHCFDKAKEGYTNLLNIKDKKSLNPGDNALMINARQNFLNKNYYKKLLDYLIEYIKTTNAKTILECGAGEGYYISQIQQQIDDSKCYAIDISKIAAKKCSKRNSQVTTYVASSYNLPFKNNSIDLILVCFAPFCEEEFSRVLKKDGILIVVRPNKQHLIELRNILYEGEEKIKNKYAYNHFNMTKIDKLTYEFYIDNSNDIQNLFQMTPYAYKTNNQSAEKLFDCDFLNVTADFEISYLKKR